MGADDTPQPAQSTGSLGRTHTDPAAAKLRFMMSAEVDGHIEDTEAAKQAIIDFLHGNKDATFKVTLNEDHKMHDVSVKDYPKSVAVARREGIGGPYEQLPEPAHRPDVQFPGSDITWKNPPEKGTRDYQLLEAMNKDANSRYNMQGTIDFEEAKKALKAKDPVIMDLGGGSMAIPASEFKTSAAMAQSAAVTPVNTKGSMVALKDGTSVVALGGTKSAEIVRTV